MSVSIGFQRKINEWISSNNNSVAFRPFLVDGNPYKSRVFVVGAFPHPKFEVSGEFQQFEYMESLVDATLFELIYGEQMQSRENKGIAAFMQWLKEECSEMAVNTTITALMAESAKNLKEHSKVVPEDYEKGYDIFGQVLAEFQPEVMILHGADALRQFRQRFADSLIDHYAHVERVQDLEEVGAFAELFVTNERKIKVFACRSLSYYGKTGEVFALFKDEVRRILS
ncbi:hypothetical protein [Lysinibacillus sp. LZ02]|uniref:hypothetical protein n=1 Tax=Lysinibacillus sp. LZ02 TaxID=3420668 RepID=UPI003D364C74